MKYSLVNYIMAGLSAEKWKVDQFSAIFNSSLWHVRRDALVEIFQNSMGTLEVGAFLSFSNPTNSSHGLDLHKVFYTEAKLFFVSLDPTK